MPTLPLEKGKGSRTSEQRRKGRDGTKYTICLQPTRFLDGSYGTLVHVRLAIKEFNSSAIAARQRGSLTA